jgi:hypothetical protein
MREPVELIAEYPVTFVTPKKETCEFIALLFSDFVLLLKREEVIDKTTGQAIIQQSQSKSSKKQKQFALLFHLHQALIIDGPHQGNSKQ